MLPTAEYWAACDVTIAMAGNSGFFKCSLICFDRLANSRKTVASGFSVPSGRTAPIGVSFPSVMYEFEFHSHSIVPDDWMNDVATFRSNKLASCSAEKRAISSSVNSRCNPVS